MQIGRQVLEAFSACLLALDRRAADAPPARLMRDGLAELRTLVPFDAAWWGECSGGIDGLAPRNWLSGRLNLSADFSREWNRISQRDRFARQSIQHLDRVVRETGYADPEPAVEAFARRHDLYHVMAITRTLAGSGLLQFLALYRHQASPPFEPAHVVLFEQFSAHLMQRWSARVATLIGSATGHAAGDGQALVDAAGEFAYVGARLALLLRERFPQWDGALVPPPLAEALHEGSAAVRLGRQRLAIERCGDLQVLSLAPLRRSAVLAPRELGVALRYAEGCSHKQIARETGLSPSTVRTYLRDVYLRLGVSDKVALGRALGARRPRPR